MSPRNISIGVSSLIALAVVVPVLAAVLGTTPAWIFEGSQQDESMGEAVAMGDVNGDALDDLIVAPRSAPGRILVFSGAMPGPSTSPSQVIVDSGAGLGFTGTVLNDWNGDLYDDVAVFSSAGGIPVVQVLLGGPSGLADTPAWSAPLDCCSSGYRLAAAGDVNGDSYADLLVGEPFLDSASHAGAGKALLFLGGPTATTTPAWTLSGDGDNVFLGVALNGTGDVNADGYGDILLSEIGWYDLQGNKKGKAFLYLGSAAGPASSPIWTTTGPINSLYGSAVGAAGDVNGDGYDDIVVGDNQANVGVKRGSAQTGVKRGKAYVYHGSASGPSMTPAWTVTGSEDQDFLGDSVAARDINGDGFSDLIVSAPYRAAILPKPGKIHLFLGSDRGLEKRAAWTAEGGQPQAGNVGFRLAVGDANGDALGDLLVGVPVWDSGSGISAGRAVLYPGGAP